MGGNGADPSGARILERSRAKIALNGKIRSDKEE